jgi:cytochrome b subunit of formate dehydrogenase
MSEQSKPVSRFSAFQRIEHWVLFASFTVLALTGLPQKFALAGVSDAIIAFLGGIETVRIIHRVAATIFMLEAVYHLVVVGYKLFVLRLKASMIPGSGDVTEAIQAVLYNLGIRRQQPKAGRYNFAEKLEYWAMVWGLVMMGATGFILWNPIVSSTILPGEIIPAAKSAHGYEAVLAVLAILSGTFTTSTCAIGIGACSTASRPARRWKKNIRWSWPRSTRARLQCGRISPYRRNAPPFIFRWLACWD